MRKLNTVKPLGGKKIKLRVFPLLFFLFLSISSAGAEENALASGEKLFMENKPGQAISWLLTALREDPGNRKIYGYLGIAYEQTGDYAKAVSIYEKGLNVAGSLKGAFLTNIGNNMALQGKYDDAITYYTKAIDFDNDPDALRNRAGEYLRKQVYDKALQDYKTYLTVETNPYQEDEIKRVISLLENKIDEIASKKVEEERKKMEEAARQKKLLNKVLDSLNSAGDDTTNMSAGNENIDDYNNDFDIVD